MHVLPQVRALLVGVMACVGVAACGSVSATPDPNPDANPAATDASIVDPPSPIVEVAAGQLHACALFSDGHVACWGDNTYAALGVPTAQNGTCNPGSGPTVGCRDAPVRVAQLTNAKHIAAGSHFTCAIDATDDVWCWGLNSMGQLGHPIGEGDVQCVGTDNQAYACNPIPTRVGNVSSVAQLSLGAQHACIRTQANAVRCWGGNTQGELGIDSNAPSSAAPVTPMGLPGPISEIRAGLNYDTCAITVNGGQLWCWGFNDWAQLGPNTSSPGGGSACISFCSGVPQHAKATDFLDNTAHVWLGHGYSCRGTTNGAIECWGLSGDYKLTDSNAVSTIPTAAGTSGFDTRWEAACTVAGDGARSCWGLNGSGALGDGTFASSLAPSRGATPALAKVAAGTNFFVGLANNGDVFAWGLNSMGQLGHAQASDTQCSSTFCSASPVKVMPLP